MSAQLDWQQFFIVFNTLLRHEVLLDRCTKLLEGHLNVYMLAYNQQFLVYRTQLIRQGRRLLRKLNLLFSFIFETGKLLLIVCHIVLALCEPLKQVLNREQVSVGVVGEHEVHFILLLLDESL